MDARTINQRRKRKIDPADIWRITLVPQGEGPPMPVRMKRFLKYALRSFGLECVWMDGGDDEVIRLRRLNEQLCERVAGQSDILSRRAEREAG